MGSTRPVTQQNVVCAAEIIKPRPSRYTHTSIRLLQLRGENIFKGGGATPALAPLAKLQSNRHHRQQTNTHSFLQAGCPSCHLPSNQQCRSTEGKGLLLFNGTFSTNRLYRATEVQCISRRAGEQHNHTTEQ